MSDDTAVVEQQPAAPSLIEAYEAGHENNTGAEGKRKPESERNARLSQEEDSARELGETSQRAEHAKPKREQSLSEALNSETPDDAEQFELPAEFARWEATDIEACLGLMGLSEGDMQRPELRAMVLKELEASFSRSTRTLSRKPKKRTNLKRKAKNRSRRKENKKRKSQRRLFPQLSRNLRQSSR